MKPKFEYRVPDPGTRYKALRAYIKALSERGWLISTYDIGDPYPPSTRSPIYFGTEYMVCMIGFRHNYGVITLATRSAPFRRWGPHQRVEVRLHDRFHGVYVMDADIYDNTEPNGLELFPTAALAAVRYTELVTLYSEGF